MNGTLLFWVEPAVLDEYVIFDIENNRVGFTQSYTSPGVIENSSDDKKSVKVDTS